MAPRRHHHGTIETETPRNCSYICDGTGAIVRNSDGERVYEYMRKVTWNIFRYQLLTTWPNINKTDKDYACSLIKAEFPQPSKELEFNELLMQQEMGALMGHRRSEARDRYKEGRSRPDWCEEEIWEMIKRERDETPDLFKQQVEARGKQTSAQTSHLGSGGKAAMKRDFVS